VIHAVVFYHAIYFLAATPLPSPISDLPTQNTTIGGFSLNSILLGSGGAGILGLIIWVVKFIIDRAIPSRSDARATTGQVLETLQNTIKILQEEKIGDQQRMKDKQDRIDMLEESSEQDYDKISDLRNEILDLRNKVSQKDRHIRILVLELRKLGAQVTGVDEEADELPDITVTLNPDQLKMLREGRAQQSDQDKSPTV
jgi:hypothetical protein